MSRQSDRRKKKQKKKSFFRGTVKILFSIALVVGIVGCITVATIAFTAPRIDPANLYSLLAETSIIYDDQGKVLEEIDTSEPRTNVNFADMPDNLVNAFIALEDKTFYDHKGFNFTRLAGAVVDSFKKDTRIGGTSTLTQQLARNLYLTKERSWVRKIREAYYTVQLEDLLTKEQIAEAYLNTVFLGFNAYGVQAASQAYFSKNVQDLTLEECATLASIVKSPSKNAPLKRVENDKVDPENPNIITRDNTYTIIYDETFVDRQHLTLNLMLEQNLISEEEYNAAYSVYMKTAMHPSQNSLKDISSYFTDYLKNEVIQDLMKEYNTDETSARNMLYTGGLRIYSTLNVNMQQIAEKEFEKNSNYPAVTGLRKDKNGNILDSSKKILLYSKANYFDKNGDFTLAPSEYTVDESGNLVIYGGKRLTSFKTESQGNVDYAIEFKNLYVVEGGIFYMINGGSIVVPAEYKTRDEATGNITIKKEFLDNNGDYFVFGNGGVTIPKTHFTMREPTSQPQGAMVITDYTNGGIKTMVGGRSISGKLLYNRADSPRPPGSSIKPIAVYGPAIQTGADGDSEWTAGSTIEDSPNYVNGKLWPKNWYSSYKGWITLRTCVEQSVNVPSVRLLENIGYRTSTDFLKGLGVTSLTADDSNPAALALGGMTNGISPIEMAGAYGAFPNKGVYIKPTSYSHITNSNGDVMLQKVPVTKQAMDPGVAFIMTDILQTTVTRGIAGRAAISSQPVGGKTGTTTNNYDAWFVGVTPHYSAALWLGNDVNLQLSQGSAAAASLWSKIMQQVSKGMPRGEFAPMPDNVERRNGEYYIKGTKASGKQPEGTGEGDPTEDPDAIEGEEPVDGINTDPEAGTDGNGDGIVTDPTNPTGGTDSGTGTGTDTGGGGTQPPAGGGTGSGTGTGTGTDSGTGTGTGGGSGTGTDSGGGTVTPPSDSGGGGTTPVSPDVTPPEPTQDGIVND